MAGSDHHTPAAAFGGRGRGPCRPGIIAPPITRVRTPLTRMWVVVALAVVPMAAPRPSAADGECGDEYEACDEGGNQCDDTEGQEATCEPCLSDYFLCCGGCPDLPTEDHTRSPTPAPPTARSQNPCLYNQPGECIDTRELQCIWTRVS